MKKEQRLRELENRLKERDKLIELAAELRTAVSFLETVDTRTAEANKKLNAFLTSKTK